MKRLIGVAIILAELLASPASGQTFIVEALGQNSANYEEVTGTWATSQSRSSAGGTPDRNSRYASTAQAVAIWTFVPASTGVYDAYVTLPSTTNVTAPQVTYTLTSDDPPLVVSVNQNDGGGLNNAWFKLSAAPIPMSAGTAYTITQTETTSPGGLPCQRADAARWEMPQNEPAPRFRPGHTLLPLASWGQELSYARRKELVDRWGFALSFGRLRSALVNDLSDPASTVSRVCALAAADPKRYPLQVSIAPASSLLNYADSLPAETWCRDAQGAYILDGEGEKVWSSEAPAATSQMIADYETPMLQAVLGHAPIAILSNGGEYGLSVYGWSGEYWAQDPAVLAAKGDASWYDYISASKARQEQIVTDAMRALLPQRQLYIYYTTAGNKYRYAIASWLDWSLDYGQLRTISDIPNTSSYYMLHNTGFTGNLDMLSLMLNGIGENFTYGERFSYNWVCAGWPGPDRPPMADPDRYEGYLKCCYTAGMIGGAALFGGLLDPLDWLWQYRRLGKVHAFFSWLEPFVRASELLPGPNAHRWSTDRPAYEFPTGDENARVLARKHVDRDEWLITAWAPDGAARDVTVTIPGLGEITVEARPEAAVYRAYLEEGGPLLITLGVPANRADLDADGDVDIDDFAAFQACACGPQAPHDDTTTCIATDFEGDADVDQSDFGIFQRCYSGANHRAEPNCAD